MKRISRYVWEHGSDGAAASFDETRAFRYQVIRRFVERDQDNKRVIFVMLNPSKADAFRLDHTITRCLNYARAWGYTSYEGLNIFALRSTDPLALYTHKDPVGYMNDEIIVARCFDPQVKLVVAAWGVHGALRGRGDQVAKMTRGYGLALHCLDVTKDGFPVHPLRQLASLTPRLYTERAA